MSAESTLESFLTVAEIAQRLRVNEQTVRNWISDFRLPAVRVGRRVRIRQSDFDEFVGRRNARDSQPQQGNVANRNDRPLPTPSEGSAGDGFLGAAFDVARSMLHERPRELAPALRVLARRAELWADALERSKGGTHRTPHSRS